jgi:hypothetical protein
LFFPSVIISSFTLFFIQCIYSHTNCHSPGVCFGHCCIISDQWPVQSRQSNICWVNQCKLNMKVGSLKLRSENIEVMTAWTSSSLVTGVRWMAVPTERCEQWSIPQSPLSSFVRPFTSEEGQVHFRTSHVESSTLPPTQRPRKLLRNSVVKGHIRTQKPFLIKIVLSLGVDGVRGQDGASPYFKNESWPLPQQHTQKSTPDGLTIQMWTMWQ